jgi:hypothetical protein
MKNRMMMLLAFLAAFAITSPALAAPPAGAEDAKAEEPADAPEAPAEDAKAEDGAEAPAETGEGPKPDATDGASTDTGGEDSDGPAKLESDEEAVEALKMLVEAAKGGHWSLALALLLMLLVYAAERFGLTEKIPDKYIPWFAAGAAMAGYVAASLMVEGAALWEALAEGLVTGAAAVGLGQMFLKNMLSPPKDDAKKSEESSE